MHHTYCLRIRHPFPFSAFLYFLNCVLYAKDLNHIRHSNTNGNYFLLFLINPCRAAINHAFNNTFLTSAPYNPSCLDKHQGLNQKVGNKMQQYLRYLRKPYSPRKGSMVCMHSGQSSQLFQTFSRKSKARYYFSTFSAVHHSDVTRPKQSIIDNNCNGIF